MFELKGHYLRKEVSLNINVEFYKKILNFYNLKINIYNGIKKIQLYFT